MTQLIDRVLLAGQHMSNWLYNVGQSEPDKHKRDSMEQMVDTWDESRRELLAAKRADEKIEVKVGELFYDDEQFIFLQTENGPTMFAEIRGYGSGQPMSAHAHKICDLWNEDTHL